MGAGWGILINQWCKTHEKGYNMRQHHSSARSVRKSCDRKSASGQIAVLWSGKLTLQARKIVVACSGTRHSDKISHSSPSYTYSEYIEYTGSASMRSQSMKK